MSWYAKPSGSYSYSSTEGAANIQEMIAALSGYTDEAITAVITNSIYEGGLNPWRWQGDSYGTSRGYGLFQFTPASGYIYLSGATPNLSTTETTTGATAEDGAFQMECVVNDTLGKWVSSNWRSYWSRTTYAALSDYSSEILNTWGSGSSISQAQFAACTDLNAALFIFLACFEGPLVPNYYTRLSIVDDIYEIVTGVAPPPTPPDPPTPTPSDMLPPWFYFKMKDRNNRTII